MTARYFLRLRSSKVTGSIELNARTLGAARALAAEWARDLPSGWTLEITDDQGATVWTL